jgi:hypothetical protein
MLKCRYAGVLGVLVCFVLLAAAGPASAAGGGPAHGCLAHQLPYIEGKFEVQYTPGCTGHDEPEIDPLSSAPNSARDMTWKAVLPRDGLFPVSATGPTFWFGGTVHDPHSLFGQAFLELQFYPDAVVTGCTPDGGFTLRHRANVYTVCSPVWSVVGNTEPAAFNAELFRGRSDDPLIMHAGDTITVHYFATAARDGAHIAVRDLTTHQHGAIVLRSPTSGPLMPEFNRQKIGNALGWGAVHDAPNSFVWEIGHTSNFSKPPAQFCVPGQPICQSYNAPAWAGTSPIRIESVRFGRREMARHWAVVSDYGGRAEVLDPKTSVCSHYGGPFCIYPWYTRNADGSFSYGVDYPSTADDFHKVAQFRMQFLCGGPFGADTTYCMRRVS